MSTTEHIRQLLSIEQYSFSIEEVLENSIKGSTATKREISRLVDKKEIINLRKGFYLIIPPRYANSGKLPVQLYIEKLFRYLNRNYYIGLYSAAKIHGASHQQTHRDYIITEKPKLSDIQKGEIDIRFITSTNWPNKNILEKKSDAGIYRISSPALTIVDLIHHQTKLGGLSRMLATIEELSEELTENDIKELLAWYPHRSTLQRFGFILEEIEVNIDRTPILNHLKSGQYFPVLLSPKTNQKPGAVDNRWKVDVNIRLENDL